MKQALAAVVVVVVAGALAGCAPTFSKAGASEEQTARDHFECQRLSILRGGPLGEEVSHSMFKQCMAGRGYR